MRLFSTSLVFGSALFLGATAPLAAQTSSYGTAPATSNAYQSPSLLPLPQVAPPPAAYGNQSGLSPAMALTAADAAPQGIDGLSEAVPAPIPQYPSSPSDQPSAGAAPTPYGPNTDSAQQAPATGSGGWLGNSFSNALKGNCGGGCATDGGNCGCGGLWFGSLGGLALTRNNANRFWTTADSTNNSDQLLNTQHAAAGWGGGGEVTVGRWFGTGGGLGLGSGGGLGNGAYGSGSGGGGCNSCCGPCGLSVTYWGVSPLTGFASVTSPTNNLVTPINEQTQTGTVMMNTSLPGSPTPSTYFFDGAHEQTISRIDRINNVEVNFINQTYLTGRTQAVWLAGIRYFRFDETLTYGSVAGGHNFGDNGGANEAYLRNRSINNLVGPQIGVQLSHYITPRWGVYATPKFGIYGNQASSQTTLYTGDGYTTFDLKATKYEASTIGQIDLGTNYLITPRCSIYGGFRLISITQLALSDNQFLPYLADTQGFLEPKTNGDMILYGAFGGLSFTF